MSAVEVEEHTALVATAFRLVNKRMNNATGKGVADLAERDRHLIEIGINAGIEVYRRSIAEAYEAHLAQIG